MCGICGIINFKDEPVHSEEIQKMMSTMKHRGPDDEGLFIDGNVGLGFVRLSILDLSPAGHQPMFTPDKRFCIIFNGEIYNYIELRRELQGKYNFITGTDTEVILASYLNWGEDCINRFNGMWAFAIYDTQTKRVFISRDRFGIKPFYYYKDKNKFIFASDIPPLFTLSAMKKEPNYQILQDFLVFNRIAHSEDTFFKGIKKLQHSHSISVDKDSFNIKRWYDLDENIGEPFKSHQEFLELFKDSIKLRLRSDVQIGACLSGGLDSSAIVSTILRYYERPDLHTFSAVYEQGMRGDESEFIAEFNGQIRNMHFTRPNSQTLYDDLEDYVEALVEPIPNTSEYAEYKVMQLAKNHCTVILNGQGADEQMAGYDYFWGYYFKELLLQVRCLTFVREVNNYVRVHRSLLGLQYFVFALMSSGLKHKVLSRRKNYLLKDFSESYPSTPDIVDKFYASKSLNEFLRNHFEYKFEHHLIWADRSGMRFSLETRFPFLDHRLVEKILAMRSNDILTNGISKKFMRDSLENILPDKIRNRMDKVGYETPAEEWIRDARFVSIIRDLFNSQQFKSRGIFDHRALLELFEKHLTKKINAADDIWKTLHTELWFRKFID